MSDPRELFRQRIEDLVGRFERDVDSREWVTKLYPKRMRDADLRVFEVPALYLQKGPTRLLLDPIGYDVPGAEAAADLYLIPTYDDKASLFLEDGRWSIHYASLPDPMAPAVNEAGVLPLTADAINEVLDAIATHAIPSV